MTGLAHAAGIALVADDDPGQRLLLEQALRQAGFDVVAVVDGAAAVDRASVAPPAIIFLDVVMPRKAGLEACLNAGMDDFISKPYTLDELGAEIARWSGQPVHH